MASPLQVKLTKAADEDLNAIIHYSLTNYGSASAKEIHKAILKRLDEIVDMPERFPPYVIPNRTFERTYRYALVKQLYRIVYTLRIVEQEILVMAITYKRVDPSRIFTRLEEE